MDFGWLLKKCTSKVILLHLILNLFKESSTNLAASTGLLLLLCIFPIENALLLHVHIKHFFQPTLDIGSFRGKAVETDQSLLVHQTSRDVKAFVDE